MYPFEGMKTASLSSAEIVKGSSVFHPGWRRDLTSYSNKVRFVFKQESHLINLVHAFWNTEEPLYGLPHQKPGELELIVPAETLPLINEKCFEFRVVKDASRQEIVSLVLVLMIAAYIATIALIQPH